MRIIFLPDIFTILLCFIVWPLLQIIASLISHLIPDRYYWADSAFYRSHHFERDGRIYSEIFHVNKWKHPLPDGATIWNKKAFRKKKMANFSPETLDRFLVESARAEMTHWLAILPFWVFGFFTPPSVIFIMLIYALMANLPCIIVQRYNRPRVKRILEKMRCLHGL